MKGTLDCIPCIVRQAVEISRLVFTKEEERQNWIKEKLKELSQKDFLNTIPPFITQEFFSDLVKTGGIDDPYKKAKEFYNKEIMTMEGDLQKRIDRAEDPLKEALTLAIAGNIIDFGTPGGVSRAKVDETLNRAEEKGVTKDDSALLFQAFSKSKKILYLGDNCGEIVFDKLFIREILKQYPTLSVTFAVRGGPILNDVLIEDCSQTEMDKLVPVISNGDNAPGTRLDFCSDEFLKYYHEADIVISKGQGNFETLEKVEEDNIYFLFMTKCSVISEKLDLPLHSLVCLKNS